MDPKTTDTMASEEASNEASSAPTERTTLEIVQEQLDLFDNENAGEDNDNIEHEDGQDQQSEPDLRERGQPESEQGERESASAEALDDVDEDGQDQGLNVLETPEYLELQARYEEVEGAEDFLAYIREQDLTEDDVHRALELATLYNTDPQRALEYFSPMVTDLQAKTGQALYPEIQSLVDDGEMTEQAAHKYQKSLIERAQLQEQQQFQQQSEQAQQEQQAQQQAQQQEQYFKALENNANAWESQIKVNDPDYDVPLYEGGNTKGQEVLMTVTSMINSYGYPQTIEQQNALLKQAYDSVNLKINRMRGDSQRAIKPPPQSSAVKNSGDKPDLVMGEASTHDIVRRMLGLS